MGLPRQLHRGDGGAVNTRETRLTTANDVLNFLAEKETTTGGGVFVAGKEISPENYVQGKGIEAQA